MVVSNFFLALAAAVAVHELGHAAAARLVGVRVDRVQIGWGQRVIRVGVLDVRLVPTGGMVLAEPSRPWQGIVIAAAGVLAQWSVLALAMATGLTRTDIPFWGWYLGLALVALLHYVPLGRGDGALILHYVRQARRAKSKNPTRPL